MEINYKIKRSARRSIALEINREGLLTVRAPYGINDGCIAKLLEEKSDWINKKIRQILERKNAFRRKEFINGEKFLYTGEAYALRITSEGEFSVIGKEILLPEKIIPLAKYFIIKWYKISARRIISERADVYTHRMNLKYGKIKISDAMTRWGSCSARNNLSFSWRLVMAPIEIIDYVIVHEIIHIVEKNHSENFWKKVGDIMPDFKEKRRWLRVNGHLLDI